MTTPQRESVVQHIDSAVAKDTVTVVVEPLEHHTIPSIEPVGMGRVPTGSLVGNGVHIRREMPSSRTSLRNLPLDVERERWKRYGVARRTYATVRVCHVAQVICRIQIPTVPAHGERNGEL